MGEWQLQGGLVAVGVVLLAGLSEAAPAEAPIPTPPPTCSSPAYRQFDFWVGEWEVSRPGSDEVVARSLIEKLYHGCALRENWMPLKGSPGGSLNVYRSKTGEWRQVWTDSGNEVHEYRGRWTGKAMEFEGEAKDAADLGRKVRMTFEPMSDGSVVQTGYQWSDKGWALEYQFTYRHPRAG